jgi:DNA adenine methylase
MSTALIETAALAAPAIAPGLRRDPLRAPFPWFGGKSRVAALVWDRFGADVKNYVEPFAGSLAVLLARPAAPGVETVNDLDCYVANFWRALKADPDELAELAGEPINEADLHARHLWLVNRAEFRERMKTDPDYFDVKIAGWWVWGICQWIGSGWCSATHRKLPNIAAGGQRGVLRPSQQLPQLSGDGSGAGRGVQRFIPEGGLELWLWQLSRRLGRVRVCCGDWRRILTAAPTTHIGTTAVFLDPPYAADDRDGVYAEESRDVAHDARLWAIENGRNPDLRIALCGYESPDYAMPPEWKAVAWKANGGFANQGNDNRGRANALRETIWFSPACLEPQGMLF